MSTVEVVKDRIKAMLDERCLADYWYKCAKYRVAAKDSITHRAHTCEVQCWMCHENDAISETIAEEVGK